MVSRLTEPSLANMNVQLVLSGILSCLRDGNEKCVRLVLDLLVFHFPLHEDGIFTVQEKVSLVEASLALLVTSPQNATLRRVER